MLQDVEQRILPSPLPHRHQALDSRFNVAAVAAGGVGVHHLASAQGVLGGADHEQVALHGRNRLLKVYLRPSLLPRPQNVDVKESHPGGSLAGEEVKGDAFVVLKGPGGVLDQPQLRIQPGSRPEPPRGK